MKIFLARLECFSFCFVILIGFFGPYLCQAQVTEFISGEIGPNNSGNRDIAEALKDDWQAAAIALGACDASFEVGDLEGLSAVPYPASGNPTNNTVQFTISGIPVQISNRDMSNIFGATYADLIGDPGGVVSLASGAALQDGAPRPSSLYNTSNHPDFINELSGSGSSRNALLIEFTTPVRAFGSWFGDLETSELGTDAILRLFDSSNSQIGADIVIPADTDFLTANGNTTSDCGAPPSGSDITGCGNSTTRFIGFVSEPGTFVSSMLVIVGDDDQPPSTFEGLTEHMSLLGPSLNNDFSCTDVNLSVFKNDLRDPVEPGENLVFELVVSNFGSQTATSVELVDNLPSEYNFVSAVADNGGSCSHLAGVVTCDLGTVDNAELVTIRLEVETTIEGTFSNEACVSAAEDDTDMANDCTMEETRISSSDTAVNLTVFKNDIKDPVEPGGNVQFEITVLNFGTTTASAVELLDTLPPEYSFVSASADNGGTCSEVAGAITCSLGAVANGEIITVTVEASSSIEGVFTNQACVSSAETDADLLDNCSAETTMIMPFSMGGGEAGLATVMWNGFCDQQNFIALTNTCSEQVQLTLNLRGSDGSILSRDLIFINAGEEVDYSVNAMAGFSIADYGIVELGATPADCISGDMGLFAPISEGQFFTAPIRTDSLAGTDRLFSLDDGSSSNVCYASFNTFNPSLDPSDSQLPTIHWLQLANLESTKEEFTVNRYDHSGSFLSSGLITVGPMARIDLAAGHEDRQVSRYGTVEVVPKNAGINYTAQLFRYGVDQSTVAGERLSSFDFADNCSTGSNEKQYLSVSRGANANSWVELQNISSETETVLVRILSNTKGEIERREIKLAAKASIHFDAVSSLDPGESGVVEVLPLGGLSLLAKSTSYIYKPNGQVQTASTTEGRSLISSLSFVGYNSFRNQQNWLRIYNVSDELIKVRVNGLDQDGSTILSQSRELPASSGEDIYINGLLNLGSARVGQIKIEVSQPGSALAELVRIQHDQAMTKVLGMEIFPSRAN